MTNVVMQPMHISLNKWMQEAAYGPSSLSPPRSWIFLPFNLVFLFFTCNLRTGSNGRVTNFSIQMLLGSKWGSPRLALILEICLNDFFLKKYLFIYFKFAIGYILKKFMADNLLKWSFLCLENSTWISRSLRWLWELNNIQILNALNTAKRYLLKGILCWLRSETWIDSLV